MPNKKKNWRAAMERQLNWIDARLQASIAANLDRGLLGHAVALIALAHVLHQVQAKPRPSREYGQAFERLRRVALALERTFGAVTHEGPAATEAYRDIRGLEHVIDNLQYSTCNGVVRCANNWCGFNELAPIERFEHEFLDLHGHYPDGSLPPSEIRRIRDEEKAAARVQRKAKPKAKSPKRPAAKTMAPARRKPPTKREMADDRAAKVTARRGRRAARAAATESATPLERVEP